MSDTESGGARLPFATKLWFGFGQISEGMKNGAYNAFLLLYYSQVLGLDAKWAGAAMFIALFSDALTDPIVGSLSDGFRSRFGRRHPFMVAAVLPLGVCFYLSFSPPAGLSQLGLFGWMVTWTVLARAAMTLYHVPHLALGAELSHDYTERSVVVAYRIFFGYGGAAVLFIVARRVMMRPTEAYPEGQLNPDAYGSLGLVFGVLMGVAILVSASGTRDQIARLPGPSPDQRGFSFGGAFAELRQALGNASFRALFVGLLVFFVARGVEQSLGLYVGTYFWRLGSDAIRIPVFGLFGVLLGTAVFARLAGRIEKRRMFLAGFIGYSAVTVILPTLKLVGAFPSETSELYRPIIYVSVFLAALMGAAALVASGSMLADIADEHELQTGRRQEGIFFGALSFSGKASTGLGSGLGALALSVIAFPRQARPGEVPESVVTELALVYGPGSLVFVVVAALMLRGYRLTRERHQEVQAALGRGRA